MKINFDKATSAVCVVNGKATLSVVAACGGVTRVVNGFTTREERNVRAKQVFADIIKGEYEAPTDPKYGDTWAASIDAKPEDLAP